MSRARRLALAGTALCTLAALFAIPALYVPGLTALALAALAPSAVRLSAAGARVALAPVAETTYEGQRVRTRIELARGVVRLPGTTLSTGPDGGGMALTNARSQSLEFSLLAPRRGLRVLGPARLRISDPFGICAREVLSEPREIVVLPRVEHVDARAAPLIEGRGAPRRARTPASDALRPYQPGAPAARIHWPTVARTGALMERAEMADGEAAALIVLDAEAPASEDALDRAVRATASLCLHLARRSGCDVLLPGAGRPVALRADLRSWPDTLRSLALVAPGGACRLGALRGEAARLLYVTAAREGVPPVHRHALRIGPHPIEGRPVAFTVAGCSAQSLQVGTWALSA